MNKLCLLLFIATSFFSCKRQGAEYVDELDVTITRYDPAYDFKNDTNKYIMSDTILHIKDGEENDDVDRKWDAQILSEIEGHLTSLGYERTDYNPGDTPELIDAEFAVLVSAISDYNYGFYWWGYPGWGYYPGWGWPGWGYPGYPGYPGWGYPVSYSYRVGTLIVEFADIKNPVENPNDPGNEVYPIFFYGAVNGLLQGSDSYINSRLEAGLDDMFTQAPF